MSYSTFPNIVQDRFGHLSGDKAYKDWTPAEYAQQEETIGTSHSKTSNTDDESKYTNPPMF